MKTAGSGSISQRHGSADPNPDPHQNVMDPAFPCREEKRLRRKEDTLLRELRIFLRDIWAKINRESKFFMFRLVIDAVPVRKHIKGI